MAAFTTAAIAAVGVGVAAYGMQKQQKAAKASQAAQDQALAIQQRQEELRQKQMELDSQRRQREIIRAGIKARSLALATATAQGAASGSGVAGGMGEIAARTATNALGVEQNRALGAEMFGTNRSLLGAYRAQAAAQTNMGMGSALTSLGGMVLQNSQQISRIGTYAANGFGIARGTPGYGTRA